MNKKYVGTLLFPGTYLLTYTTTSSLPNLLFFVIWTLVSQLVYPPILTNNSNKIQTPVRVLIIIVQPFS